LFGAFASVSGSGVSWVSHEWSARAASAASVADPTAAAGEDDAAAADAEEDDADIAKRRTDGKAEGARARAATKLAATGRLPSVRTAAMLLME
jgi:hypothetical protein